MMTTQETDMNTSIEEAVYKAFSAAIGRGDLESAFEHTTEDVTFRPIGSHPELGREFKGKQDITENCWFRVFAHLDENLVAITVKNIATADGIAFVEFIGSGTGRSGMTYNNEYVHVIRYRGDKICAITEYLDTALLNQLLEQ